MLFDDRVCIFFDDTERNADLGQIIRQDIFGKTGLLLIEVNGEDLELDRSSPLHIKQQIEHRVTVLSARETDHDLVAVLDHAEVADCSTEFFQQLGFGLSLYKQLFDLPPKRQIFACQYSFNKSQENALHAATNPL